MSCSALHTNCREILYAKNVKREIVPDNKVPWTVEWPEYKPTIWQMKSLFGSSSSGEPTFEQLVTGVHDVIFNCKEENGWNRLSYLGPYDVVEFGPPLNPCGRTGLIRCGNLQLWGPNH